MQCEQQHRIWCEQVQKLNTSLDTLSETSSENILSHFFLKAVENECAHELESVKSTVKDLLHTAIRMAPSCTGSVRLRAIRILHTLLPPTPILASIRLADIRNVAVFEMYKRCGITIDTYFERYSSPPGTLNQNEVYAQIAHGNAKGNGRQLQQVTDILLYIQLLKRFFYVYDMVTHVERVPCSGKTLNWCGAMWVCHVEEHALSDLIWELYIDIWTYENTT